MNLKGSDHYQTTIESHVETIHPTVANKKNSKEIDLSTSGVMMTLTCNKNFRPNRNFSKLTISKKKNKDSKTIWSAIIKNRSNLYRILKTRKLTPLFYRIKFLMFKMRICSTKFTRVMKINFKRDYIPRCRGNLTVIPHRIKTTFTVEHLPSHHLLSASYSVTLPINKITHHLPLDIMS